MSRRTRLRTRPQRSLAMGLVALAVAASLPVLGTWAWRTITRSTEGRVVTVAGPPSRRLPFTSGVLLAAVDRTQRVVGLTLFSLRESTPGANVVVLPVGSRVDADDGSGVTRLAASYDTGGHAALTRAVSGLLGVDLATSVEMGEAELAALFTAVAPIPVHLDEPVIDTAVDGKDAVLFPPGAVSLSAQDAARFLLARSQSQSEVARLPRIEAFWRAAQARGVSLGPVAAPAGTPTAPAAVATALGGPGAVTRIEAPLVADPSLNPSSADMLEADIVGIRLLMAEVLPGAISPVNTNARIWIEDPVGDPATLRAAVGKLVFVGANIVWITTGTGSPPSSATLTYQSGDRLAELRRYAAVTGSVTEVKGTDKVDGVDGKITIGTIFHDLTQADVDATSTTTTLPPTTLPPTTISKTTKTTKPVTTTTKRPVTTTTTTTTPGG